MAATINTANSIAQDEKKFAEQTIIQFVKGTASQDVYNMHYLLHEDFHALIPEIDNATVSKSEYMKMLSWKKLGGEEKEVEIVSLDLALNTAAAKVKIMGKNGFVEAYYHLSMDTNGSWQLLHVLPFVPLKFNHQVNEPD
jgi:Putative lumazine-binding